MNMNTRKSSQIARFVAPALLIAAAAAGVAYWGDFPRDAGAAARGSASAEAAASVPAPFEYFPAQYVNQAKEAEQPVPSF